MGVFQVGRVAAEAPLDGLRQIEHGGDRVQIDVDASMGVLSAGVAVRQQSLGLVDSDERVVPVFWDGDSSVDGFYEPLDVSVTPDPDRYISAGHVRMSASLRRVQGFAAPLFESVLLGAKRADTTSAQAFHAVPATAKGYETGVLTPTFTTIASESGSVLVLRDATNVFFNARSQYFLKPRDWYAGAASLKVGGATVIGPQARNLPDQWVLSNGIVRLVGKAGGWFTTERWNGTGWVNPGDWVPGIRAGGGASTFTALEAPHTITVMRNSPQSVIIRLTTDVASALSGDRYAVTVDIELRRGATLADMVVSTRGTQLWGILTPLDFATKTNFTNGAGQGGLVVAYRDTSARLDIGGKTVVTAGSATTSVNVGVGYPFIGAGPEQAAISMWCAVQSENVIVAAR